MKIKLLVISLILAIIPIANITNATNYDSVIRGYHMENNNIDGDVMYFDDLIIEQIDAKTFKNPESINMGYGHDKNNVYYQGEYVLKGLNPKSYKIDSSNIEDKNFNKVFAYDKNTICIKEQCIESEGGENIQMIDDKTFRAKNNIIKFDLYNNLTVIAWDSVSEIVVPGYEITDDTVYWYGSKIKEADGESFEIVNCDSSKNYAKDKNNIYIKGQVIYNSDVKSFNKVIIDELRYCADNRGLYSDNGEINFSTNDIKKEYPQEVANIEEIIQFTTIEYETKYPGYEPQPATPPIKVGAVFPYGACAIILAVGGVIIARKRKK